MQSYWHHECSVLSTSSADEWVRCDPVASEDEERNPMRGLSEMVAKHPSCSLVSSRKLLHSSRGAPRFPTRLFANRMSLSVAKGKEPVVLPLFLEV